MLKKEPIKVSHVLSVGKSRIKYFVGIIIYFREYHAQQFWIPDTCV